MDSPQERRQSDAETPKLPYDVPSPGSNLTAEVIKFFEKYCGLRREEAETHVTAVRNKGWRLRNYPCVGQYTFLNSALKTHPLYTQVLQTLREPGTKMLDVGTCFGQEIRYLIEDGVPSTSLFGVDLIQGFWDLGYDLYRDADTNKARFICADLLDNDALERIQKRIQICDIINISCFFHLFDREGQLVVLEKIIALSKPGTIVIGEQVGKRQAMLLNTSRGPRFFHDRESWANLWNEIEGVTSTKWTITSFWNEWTDSQRVEFAWMGPTCCRLKWSATRVY